MKKNHHETPTDVSPEQDVAANEQIIDMGAAPEGGPAIEPEVVPAENDCEALKREVGELNDKLLRLTADFENFRKRSYKEMTAARAAAVADTVQPFLHVLDIFNMALASIETSPNIDAIKQGMGMIMNEYDRAMTDLGVSKIEALGLPFDPTLHEAMAKEPSPEKEGQVIKQWSCGYKMGDRLLRPARVVVSSGTAEK